jgi:hypothetical protein
LNSAVGWATTLEKPKVGGLQIDWHKAEDLKEEKVVITPMATIAG